MGMWGSLLYPSATCCAAPFPQPSPAFTFLLFVPPDGAKQHFPDWAMSIRRLTPAPTRGPGTEETQQEAQQSGLKAGKTESRKQAPGRGVEQGGVWTTDGNKAVRLKPTQALRRASGTLDGPPFSPTLSVWAQLEDWASQMPRAWAGFSGGRSSSLGFVEGIHVGPLVTRESGRGWGAGRAGTSGPWAAPHASRTHPRLLTLAAWRNHWGDLKNAGTGVRPHP